MALGIWAGVSGLGVALGPFVGGAVVEGIAWQWIFWLNVPIGLVLIGLAARRLTESHGPAKQLDLPGLGLVGAGLFGLTFGIVRATELGWTSATVVGSIGGGVALLAAFLWWEMRAPAPMLPLRFFRSRAFSASNGVSFAMFFGVFGAIFLLAQFFQTAQGYGPFEAGLRTLPWTGMPMIIAPIAGLLSDRIGSRPLMVAGLALQAVAMFWLAAVSAPDTAYSSLIAPFILAGTGMSLVFAPSANAILSAVRPEEAGRASAPRTRSASSVASWAWRCWRRSSARTARTPRRRRSAMGSWRRCRSPAWCSPSARRSRCSCREGARAQARACT